MSVAVVGSINVDVTVAVSRAPEGGQTLLGGDARRFGGGKGANQAVALARLGRPVHMVGAVGEDGEGDWLLARLASEGIDIGEVRRTDRASGQAFVFISPDGDSTIVVAPGANAAVTPEQASSALVAHADAVLLQQEIPADAVAAAVAAAEGLVMLNPAPARAIDPAVLAGVDLLVPNRGELAELVGASSAGLTDEEQIATAARSLGVRGSVVVTLGAGGSLVVTESLVVPVPALEVDVVDATAAGDSFCAGLVDAMLNGADVVEATRFATRVASITVTREGAMDALPYRSQVAPAVT
jgi:ribokinase